MIRVDEKMSNKKQRMSDEESVTRSFKKKKSKNLKELRKLKHSQSLEVTGEDNG